MTLDYVNLVELSTKSAEYGPLIMAVAMGIISLLGFITFLSCSFVIWGKVRFLEALIKRIERYRQGEYPDAPQNQEREIISYLLEKTYYELFQVRSQFMRRRTDSVMKLLDDFFYVQFASLEFKKNWQDFLVSFNNRKESVFDSLFLALDKGTLFRLIRGRYSVHYLLLVISFIPSFVLTLGVFAALWAGHEILLWPMIQAGSEVAISNHYALFHSVLNILLISLCFSIPFQFFLKIVPELIGEKKVLEQLKLSLSLLLVPELVTTSKSPETAILSSEKEGNHHILESQIQSFPTETDLEYPTGEVGQSESKEREKA